jgi:hypothetical protein
LDQHVAVPVIVVSRLEERAEAVNSCLRNGGRVARIRRVDDAGDLLDGLGSEAWQLAVVFADESGDLLGKVIAVLAEAGLDVPVVSCRETLDEDRMAADMAAGADDTITPGQVGRMLGVLDELAERVDPRALLEGEVLEELAVSEIRVLGHGVLRSRRPLSIDRGHLRLNRRACPGPGPGPCLGRIPG